MASTSPSICNTVHHTQASSWSYLSFHSAKTMNQSTLFSSGTELAPFLTSTGLLQKTWNIICSSSGDEGIVSNEGQGLSWKIYKDPSSDFTIIAFEAPTNSNLQADLVPSSVLLDMNFHHFDFLCTKRNPIFHVDRTAFSLFYENHQKLDAWKTSEINSSTRLIVTGHGVGGSVASLFTISLLESLPLGKNRPLCITYGSPLIGDKRLQQAISRRPIWNSCFLHVVSLKDPLPRLFITNRGPQTGAYMPFGTFIFCSDVNSTCFENPDSILEILMALGSIHNQNQGFQFTDYGCILENLSHKTICKDLTTLAEDMPLPLPASKSPLASGIRLQFQALGLTPQMQQQNIDINSLVRRMANLETKFIFLKGKKSNPSKKLNAMKMDMVQLEWYKKDSKNRNIGYYDSYKNMSVGVDFDVVKFHRSLTNYWEKMVEEAQNKPQKGGAAFRRSWLYAGTSYRRMVEPLAIAEFYRNGGKDYMKYRSHHFKLLEEWFGNETTKADRRSIEAILTVDNSYYLERIGKELLSREPSMVAREMEYNFDISSDEENEEESSTFGRRFVSEFLRSSKELNGTVKDIEPCFESRVDGAILSRRYGSVVVKDNEKSIRRFESLVDYAVLSRRHGSLVVKDNEKSIRRFESLVDYAVLSRRLSTAGLSRRQSTAVVRDRRRKINVEVILTTDSCFWARVEEALLLCQEFKIIQEKQETLWKLVQFEDYVYEMLRNYEVSSEIFLRESSYMRWWNEYKGIKGTEYNSELAAFMNDPGQRVRYSLGAYDFP